MRIISGKYRGKKLKDFYCDETHPTTDRVKENIFNVLADRIDFFGISVLDLFAGTGQYGIECLSRGAGLVTFNDANTEAIKTIKKNLVGLDGEAVVLQCDYREVLRNPNKYDLIFLDPPYDTDFGKDAIDFILSHGLLSVDGIIVFETDKILPYLDKKSYGRTNVYFVTEQN